MGYTGQIPPGTLCIWSRLRTDCSADSGVWYFRKRGCDREMSVAIIVIVIVIVLAPFLIIPIWVRILKFRTKRYQALGSRTSLQTQRTHLNPISPSRSPQWVPPPKQRCGVCQGGTNPCYGCSNGYVHGSQTERHITCGGTGRVKCAMCDGTGYR
jgi:hypothetical protein